MPRHNYPALARAALTELLETQLAVVWPEVEARLADVQWPTARVPIDPHHLTTARQQLVGAGLLLQDSERTRGGRVITVLTPGDQSRRKRAIESAAARKRLLQGRYQGWASGTPSIPGVVGPAGEAVVHRSLTAAAPHGYRLLNPATGHVRRLLGARVPGGPLDNGAFFTPVDSEGQPGQPYVVMVEVKNIRHWIYPRSAELHQLLHKAAGVQLAHPTRPLLPVLVCRRAHFTTFRMAESLGFYVIQTKRQYMQEPASLDPVHFEEVRAELGYRDLAIYGGGPEEPMVRHFTTLLPAVAERTATAWAIAGPALADHLSVLRRNEISEWDRHAAQQDLRTDARDVLDLDDQRW